MGGPQINCSCYIFDILFSESPTEVHLDGSQTRIIQSPNHPGYYHKLENTKWYLTTDPGTIVGLRIIAFNTEADYDFLKVRTKLNVIKMLGWGGLEATIIRQVSVHWVEHGKRNK